jgi:Zn-dependent protease
MGASKIMFNLKPDDIICRVITLIIALTVHEFSHALIADRLGDTTPRAAGQLTLNPLVHLDFFGSLMVLLTGYGWAKPTPINPYALRQNSKFAIIWVSIAGPISNLLLAAIAAIPLRLGLVQVIAPTGYLPTLGEFIYVFFYINLILAVFNLIPFPPLDGEKILSALLPESAAAVYEKIRPYGPFVLMILIFFGPTINLDLIGWIMTPILNGLQHVMLGV